MKYNPILRSKKAAGFTLIEISLVIALLLGLIGVVFLGLGSYREGANQAQCRMQLAAVQKAVRSYANLQNMVIGAALPTAAVFGPGLIMEVQPVCPAGGVYTSAGNDIPAIGVPYIDCSIATPDHILAGDTSISDW